jgi:hypothetical protein
MKSSPSHKTFFKEILIMANRYWVGGTDTWNSTAGSKWSTTSGGAGGASAPGSSDDVIFDGNSVGTVTLSSPPTVKSVTCNSWNGTWAGSSDLTIQEGLTLSSTMTNNWTGKLIFNGSGTYDITSNGITVEAFETTGTGFYRLQSPLTVTDSITITQGSFVTNSNTLTADSFFSQGSQTRDIYLAGSTINLSTDWIVTGSNVTVYKNPLPSVQPNIILSGANCTFNGGGLSYGRLSFTGTNTISLVKGANTFWKLTHQGSGVNTLLFDANQTIGSGGIALDGPSITSRLFVGSTVTGTQRSIDNPGGTSQYANFQDIASTSSNWFFDDSTTGAGNCGNNSGIYFRTAQTVYWVGGTGNYSDSNHWSNSSGGSGGARVPIPQDTVNFDANSFSSGSQTVTFDMPQIAGVNWTGVTNSPTLSRSVDLFCAGSVTLVSGMSISGTGVWTLCGTGSTTLTTAGQNWSSTLKVSTGSGTLTLQDHLTITGGSSLILLSGTLNANNKNVTIADGLNMATSTAARTLTMGSGTWTLQGSSGVFAYDATNLTVNANTSTIVLSNTTAATKNFLGSGKTFYNLRINGAASCGPVVFDGGHTFNTITLDPNAHVKFAQGSTNTVTSFSATGTSGNVITIESTSAGSAATLSCASGTINCDYLSLKDSTATGGATWHAGANSTNVSGNSGWQFP